MRRLLLSCASVLAFAAIQVPVAQAQAQPVIAAATTRDTTDVGELVVTARRREERLRDVPVAASVIDAQVLADRGGVSDVGTLLSTVPSLHYFNTSTPGNSEISLRASGTSRGTSAEAAVGLYRNGAYIGGGGNLGGRNFAGADLFDIGRVEVLRGTQAALYGRNAVGGTINVISATPTDKFEGYADEKYSINNKKSETQLVLNLPVTDELAVRLGANYVHQTGGFFYNPDNDKYFDAENSNLIRGQVKWTHGKFDITLLGENQVAAIPTLYWQLYILPSAATGFPLGLVQNKYVYPWNSAPTAKQNVETLQALPNYQFDQGTLSGTFMYRKRHALSAYDNDSLDQAALNFEHARGNATLTTDANSANINQNEATTHYADVHFASTKFGPLSFIGGVEYLKIHQYQHNETTRTPTKANTSLGNLTVTLGNLKSISGYGSVSYDLTSDLNISGEARYTHDDREADVSRVDKVTLVPITTGNLITHAETKPNNFTYNVIAGYHLNTNWLTYAKVGTGFRAGGFNTSGGDPRQPVQIPLSFNDEKSFTIEGGAKGNLSSHIYTTLAVYRSTIKDFLVQQDNGCAVTNPACPVASTTFLINAGKARTWGVELEGTGRWTVAGGDLRVNTSVAKTHGTVIAGPYAGRKIPQSSDWNGSAAVNYRHDLVGELSGFANANYTVATGGVQEIEQTPILHDHDSVDMRLGVDYRNIEAAVFATNLLNTSYIIYETSTMRRYNQPRVYGVQLHYKW